MNVNDKDLSDQLALIAWEIESDIENCERVKDHAKRLAKVMKERDDFYFEILQKKIEHERKLRELNRERKEESDRRLLFIILYFVLRMMKHDAEFYAAQHDDYFEELKSGIPTLPDYNGF